MRKTAFLVLAAILFFGAAHAEGRIRIGEEVVQRYESPHPYRTAFSDPKTGVVWSDRITYPGAAYIAPHFSRFHLAEGDAVIVSAPDGSRSWTYTRLGNEDLGESADGFWGINIPGDTAIIELRSSGSGGEFGYAIDRFARGYLPQEMGVTESTEQICGNDDSNWAKCYQFTEPRIYERSRAIARLTIQGQFLCTGWLIGNNGSLMTNAHCINTQAEASNTTYEFMAEGATCATDCPQLTCPGTVVSLSATLIQTSPSFLDFTLVRLPSNPTCTYGYVPLRASSALGNERIYIPNHSAGKGKRIAVFSTDPTDESGFCEVAGVGANINCAGFPGIDLTYKADTEGGSSGSPVVAYSDHKAIALHHCSLGNPCASSGGQIDQIINALGANLPPGAMIDRVGAVKMNASAYGCSSTVTVEVQDDTRAGAGTQAVTVTSGDEPAGETLNLVESPPGSGHFQGTIATTPSPAVPANGAISVHNGDSITASYTDADGGLPGCGAVLRTFVAAIDCAGPVISNVQVLNIQGGFVDVSWTTSEPSDSVVTFGRADTPPPTRVASSATLGTAHQMRLAGLDSCTAHLFKIQSTDGLGNGTLADNGGVYYGFTTLYEVSPSFVYTGAAVPIPDQDPIGATATINVPDAGSVLDVNVKVNVTHPRDGDLLLYLSGPDATQTVLVGLRGGSGANFTNTVLDDEAATAVGSASAPFTGSFRPEQPLSAFWGRPAAGTWTLRAVDQTGGSVGTITGFEVEITYTSRTCYNSAARGGQSLVADSCSIGGGGNGDGLIDPGEDAVIGVTLTNNGTLPLSGISATLTPITAGVVMVDDTATYPNLAPEASSLSQSPHFRATLPAGLACGSTLDFNLAITTAQGNYADTVQLPVGRVLAPIVLNESFAGGIPATWTVVDGGTGTGPAATWTTANPGGRSSVAPITTPFAIVDSDFMAGDGTQDEELITPVLDLTGSVSATLEFDQYFQWYDLDSDEKGDVDVRSSLTGNAWVNVFRNQGASSPEPDHKTINISAQAAGAANVQVRFHYYDGAWEYYWQVDNVKVSRPGGCASTGCNAAPLPGEVATLTWSSKTAAQWTTVSGATTYNVYRGVKVDLPLLLNGSIDSCKRGSAAGLTLSGLTENPAVGAPTWWVVRAQNGSGEGGTGNAHVNHATTLRTQNSSGVCP